ncbi:MAG: Smr/MutS family protein [bacterium]|nr:Smr/MutS family protein [bacterium]
MKIKRLKHIFSVIAGLFRRTEAAQAEPEAVVQIPEPPPEEEPPPPPPPVKPSPPPKVKKISKPRRPPKDKKGFHILKDTDNLAELFEVEGAGKKKREKDDFARLFEESQTDVYQQVLLREKVHARHMEKRPKPQTVTDRIRTYPAPQAELDLHGFTAKEAEKRTETFIRNARRRGIRTVRLIVGKGLHSSGKAVLPDVVEAGLIRLKRDGWVLSHKWEKKDKRKSGAVLVYLTPH